MEAVMIMQITGYNMKACCPEFPGVMKTIKDPFGNVTSMEGIAVEMLNWMTRAFNMTYECTKRPNTGENTSTSIGALHYVATGICDAIIAPAVSRYDRYKVVDFLQPFQMEPVQLMIPMPAFTSNLSAFVGPFTFQVWMVLMCVTITMIAILMLFDHLKWSPGSDNSHIGLHWLFVIGSLFGQGGFWASTKNRMRILMVVWSFGAFIIVQLYNIQLFDYVMTSVPVPIVKSAEELADNSGIDLVVVRGFAPDLTIKQSLNNPLMKKLSDKLDANPTGSRCQAFNDCFPLVNNKKRPTVLIHQSVPMVIAMMADFHQTGECKFALVQKAFDNYLESWMIRKGDPFRKFYNQGIIRLNEAGLLHYWADKFQPKPHKCLEMAKSENDPRNPAQISLTNLTITFELLLFGLILSSIVLICEKCWFVFMLRKSKTMATKII